MSVSHITPALSKRSYVSLAEFNSGLYQYSYTINMQMEKEVGSLTLNPAATALNCPKGRVLYENGKKLYPANGNFRGANDGITTYMVGVYDPISGLNGFIDPNSPLFGLQNTDKPVYLNNDNYLGNGVLTNGPIETTSSIKAGTSLVAGTYLASRQINVALYNAGGNSVPYTSTNTIVDVFIDATAGNVFVISTPRGSSLTNIYVYFNSNTSVPVSVAPVNGSLMTLIFVNYVNNPVNVNFGGIIKRTSNTIVLPDGDPTPQISNIMFASANNYIIELNRSGVMAL
jgi:hypothetical protein